MTTFQGEEDDKPRQQIVFINPSGQQTQPQTSSQPAQPIILAQRYIEKLQLFILVLQFQLQLNSPTYIQNSV